MLIGNWKGLLSARAAYERLRALLAAHPQRKAGMALPRPKGQLAAEGVGAAVPGTQQAILRHESFSLAPGEVLAVLGPSASGKSTLARVLVGVWPAAAGSVRLDGADLHQWNRDELGPCVGYLPQDIELFNGTIAENIARFGSIDSVRVIEAAQRSGMHEIILRLPKGYDTPIDDAGAALSGGTRQRVGLARALYGDPVLVVLDEPNSNLDEQGEAALLTTLQELKQRGCAVVLITHRMNTIGVADKVLVLIDGQVKAFGPRERVMNAIAASRAAVQPRAAGLLQEAASGGVAGA
jgi:PrtD family type I secretion system ABC transporter